VITWLLAKEIFVCIAPDYVVRINVELLAGCLDKTDLVIIVINNELWANGL